MIRALLFLGLLAPSLQQQAPLSPCPNVFSYEKPGSEPGRWYGEVNLSTDSILHSVWINVVLDSKADILGNWVGDVTTTDNIDFKIENTKMKIHPGPATAVRFFVQYNPLNKAPKLQAIRLNGREICNANNPLPAVERPDEDRRTTSRPRPDLRPEDLPVSRPVQGQPAGNGPVYSSTESPVQQTPVVFNIGGGQIPAQNVGTQTGSGIVSGTQTGNSFTGTQTGNRGTGSQTGNRGTGTQTGNRVTGTQTGNRGTGSQTGNSFTDTQSGNSFTDTQTGNTFTDTQTGNSFSDSQSGNSFTGTQTGNRGTSSQTGNRGTGTQTGNRGTGTQTGNSFTGRPDNGFRLTTVAPSRTTSRYDEDGDFDDGQGDYFGGGQPTFIVPGNTGNNNNYQPNNNNAQLECGKVVRNNPNPLVVNGRPTLEGQWPWQIALYHTQTVDSKYICGGTLVSRRHVITAAHCVTRKGSSRVVNPNTLTVYLGKHNLRTSVEGVQIKFVSEVRVHPAYNASSYSRDLSVLKLREQVQFTDFVRPACLWPENELDLGNVIGKKGSVVGWGFDDKGLATEELTLVEMPVVDQETCIRSYSEFFARFTSEYTYCAGYKDGSSVCNGDSGGGMVFLAHNSWHLRGLVSLSVARQNEYRCDPTHYVVFTDLAKFLPWIRQMIADE